MQKFKTVVDSKHKFLDLKLKETFSYRDLIFLFVKRDFVTKYKQTILGPLWAIIQPLFSTFILFIIHLKNENVKPYDQNLCKTPCTRQGVRLSVVFLCQAL